MSAPMSVELRIVDEGVVCDWGLIEHSDPRPERGEVGPLMLTTMGYFKDLIEKGPLLRSGGALHSADIHQADDGELDENTPVRMFAHIDYNGQHWAWELFLAHWWDGAGRVTTDRILVGRWPD